MAICLKGQTGAHTRPLHQGPWKACYAPGPKTIMKTKI